MEQDTNAVQVRKKLQPMIVVCLLVLWSVVIGLGFELLANRIEIADQNRQKNATDLALQEQRTANGELETIIESGSDEMVERVARDQYNYAAPNERIFVDVSGK